MMASDDKKARNAATIELGEARVTGSLGLLRSAVISRLISPEEAFSSYRKMIDGGGFLPRVDQNFFSR
jgi:predicted nucleic acid-binding protein